MEQLPFLSAVQAVSKAIAELEHAESMAMLGPRKLKNQLILLASMLRPNPSAA